MWLKGIMHLPIVQVSKVVKERNMMQITMTIHMLILMEEQRIQDILHLKHLQDMSLTLC